MASNPSPAAGSRSPVAPPPVAPRHRPKSPPLAFEKTPNDSLVAPLPVGDSNDQRAESSAQATMGRSSPLVVGDVDLQVIIDQQADAIELFHKAFNAERQAWVLERAGLYQRIAGLEKLLKNGDHWSPAKSPVLSPSNGAGILSPQTRAAAATSLPTINEGGRTLSLSSRREAAPRTLDIPVLAPVEEDEDNRRSSVTFVGDAGIQVEEIPLPPRSPTLSPPPPINRMLAGHTPVRITRPPTPPPQKMTFEGIDDTPTRNNTHINTLLTQSSDEEEDAELKGPLNMPELPNEPDATNFTLEMLSKKLEMIERDPAQAKPMVFSERTPGLASPANEPADDVSPGTLATLSEAPLAPISTRDANASNRSSNALSPSGLTPNSTAIGAPQELHDSSLHKEFEQGGIRLKKKASVNFGAPFGSLGGFGRKLS